MNFQPTPVNEAVREFLCEYLADPDNERAFLLSIAQSVGAAVVDTQTRRLDAHSDILIDAIANGIGSRVKVLVQAKLPIP